MAYEQVGAGYSSGILPNYAEEYYQTQQNQAHRFDQYTNPFLLARNISSVFQPGIENAQKQQQVGISQQMEQIDAARQQMAQTAQNTLLPLQANMLTAQAAGLEGETALRKFQLGKMQDAYGQAPDYFSSLSTAVNSGDPSAIYNAMSQNPAAAMTYGQESGNALAYADRVSQTRMAGVVGSAQQQGADAAAKNPNMNPEDFAASLTPQQGENDGQFQQRKAAALQGFAQKQQQMQGIQAQAMNQQILAKIRSGATITAAELRALGQGVRTGQVTVDQLEQLSPGLGNAALNNPAQDFTPNPNATPPPVSRYPEQIQTEALKHYNTILENPAATPQMKDEAARQLAVVNPGLAPTLGVAVQYDPVTQAQLEGINAQEMAAKSIIQKAGADPSMTKPPSWMENIFLPDDQKNTTPLQRAIGQVQNLEMQRAQILKQQTTGAQATLIPVSSTGNTAPNMTPAAISAGIPSGLTVTDLNDTSAAPISFSVPQSTRMSNSRPGGIAPPLQAIDALRANPDLAPQFDAKYGKGAAASLQNSATVQFSQADIQKLPPQFRQRLQAALTTPNDPQAKQVIKQAQMLLSRQ